jgi:basic membrane lipoprotein Med (substrate-binding protein (PBP1-ABC) superfamily)
MKEGVVSLVYNAALKERIPSEVQARIASAQEQIIADTLSVPSVEFSPVNVP